MERMKPVHLLLLILATWRLSHLLSKEDGPYDIATRIRYWAGVRYDKNSSEYPETELGKLVMCMYCNSVWIGMGLVALYALSPKLTLLLSAPFSLSGGSLLINRDEV